MRTYTPIKFKDAITITQFYAIEYYESSTMFDLDVDVHNFWELSYIDTGKIFFEQEGTRMELEKNDLLLIPPNTTHQYICKNDENATVLFLCFSCNSPLLKKIVGLHKTSSIVKELLYKLINEIRSTFTFTFNTNIHINSNPPIGGQQMTRLYVTQILIALTREKEPITYTKPVLYIEKTDNELVNKILTYLKSNIYNTLTLDELSNRLFYSKSYLNRIFKQHMQYSIKEHYNYLKIKEAKKIIKNNPKENLASISSLLQFDNTSYFIKVFKKYTGLTPTEYKEQLLLD